MKLLKFVCAVAVVFGGTTLEACSCKAPPLPKKALAQAAAVFAGKVKSVTTTGVRKTVAFEITRTWKGTKGKTVSVMTANNSAACGYNFKVGETYLVYCYRTGGKGKPAGPLHTNICTRTATLAAAKGDLLEIGKGEKP